MKVRIELRLELPVQPESVELLMFADIAVLR